MPQVIAGSGFANLNDNEIPLYTPWWESKIVQPLWKTVWQFLTKLNMLLPYYSAITFLGIYPKEWKTFVYTKTCTWLFIAALFIMTKNWKPPRYPSVGEWININCGPSRQ